MLRVQVHDAGPASRNGQAGTAGLDEQDIPGDGDGWWPLRLVMACGVVRPVADQMSIWLGPGGPVMAAARSRPGASGALRARSSLGGGAHPAPPA